MTLATAPPPEGPLADEAPPEQNKLLPPSAMVAPPRAQETVRCEPIETPLGLLTGRDEMSA